MAEESRHGGPPYSTFCSAAQVPGEARSGAESGCVIFPMGRGHPSISGAWLDGTVGRTRFPLTGGTRTWPNGSIMQVS